MTSGGLGLTKTGADGAAIRASCDGCKLGVAACIGGFAITGPAGGLAAIAGAGGGGATTILGSCRGWGTIRRGACGGAWTTGVCLGGGATGPLGLAVAGTAATTCGGGGTGVVTGRGAEAAAAASSLRRRISRIASPGFETCDQSIFGFCPLPEERCCPSAPPRLPRCK
jgi:hypothetical protein